MPEDTSLSSNDTIAETIIICAFNCTEQNVKRCRKCNRSFCIMHCNHWSPNFCKDCFKDVAVIAEKFKRTHDEIGDNGQLHVRIEERVRYYMDGEDWPFLSPWIHTLADTELYDLILFHGFVVKLIEVESDTRKIEGLRKLRDTIVPRLISTTTTKTKTVTKVQQPETAESVRAKLKKSGVSDAIIESMIKAMNL